MRIKISNILLLFILVSLFIITAEHSVLLKQKPMLNLGYPVNTTGDDFSPSITADGKVMVFNSRERGERDHNIYITYFTNGKWGRPVPIKEINSPENDETPYISADGSLIVFSSDRIGSAMPSVTADKKYRITYDIFLSRNKDGNWTRPVRIPGMVNTGYNERSPSISHDKKHLYFTRFPFRNLRYAKIMRATFKGDKYVDVTAMPYPINSNNYDVSLRPALNDKGFYFSSMRPGGYGGWDLYFIAYQNGKYGKPVNLGYEINTEANEMFLCEAGRAKFLCSNRINSLGKYDIFTTTIPHIDGTEKIIQSRKFESRKPVETKKSTVPEKQQKVEKEKQDKKTRPKLPVIKKVTPTVSPSNKTEIIYTFKDSKSRKAISGYTVTVYLKDTDNPKAPAKRSISLITDQHGKIKINPKQDITHIVIKVPLSSSRTHREQTKVEKGRSKKITIAIDHKNTATKTHLDKKFKPVHFSSNSATIRFSSYPYLHKIINFLRDNNAVHLVLVGHADLEGSPSYNMRLSIKRARNVYRYFIKMGINKYRLRFKGMGEKAPVVKRKGKGNNKYNRRVEFIFK